MYIPPKMTQLIHEDRVRHLQHIQTSRWSSAGSTRVFKRIWTSFRQYWRRDDEWISLPLEAEPYEVAAELLRNQPMPPLSKKTCASEPCHQQGDPA